MQQKQQALTMVQRMQQPETLFPEAAAFIHNLEVVEAAGALAWFEREMLLAFRRGHYQFIPTRARDNVYLGRFWLTPPRDGGHSWESGDSLMLHFFFRPDDDKALHTHPWTFETHVLRGGYEENLPPLDWDQTSKLGPPWNGHHITLTRGDKTSHNTTDLHCVARIIPGTVTLVRTGARVDTWYFHPPGLPKVHYKKFLDEHA